MIGYIAVLVIVLVLIYYLLDEVLRSKFVISDIDRKAVVITGCGGGFGKALMIRCLRNGMTVFAGCRRKSSIEEIEADCRGLPGKLFAFQMDVTDNESVTSAKEFVRSKLMEMGQELLALVNNAGIRGTHMYDDLLTVDDYKAVWDTNTFGTIRTTQAFKALLKQSRGRVIICGSGCTLFTVPSYGPYATSKSAVSKYAEVIRHELTPYGINVILIQPGSFDSGMQDTERLLEMMQSKWDCCDASLREEYGERFIRRVKKFCKVFQQHGVSKDVKWVEDTYFNALVAKYPKPLYRIGWDTILFFHPYSLLPLRLQLAVMKFLFWICQVPFAESIQPIARSG